MRHLFGLCLALASVTSALPVRADNVYERVDNRILCLSSRFADGSETIGTAFFVAPGILATAEHQIDKARSVVAHMPSGQRQPAKLLAKSKTDDVALISIPITGPEPLPLAGSKPALGDAVFTIGCPLGLSHSLTRGVVSHADRRIGGHSYIQTDLAINQGNSGGPLINSAGQVVGIVHGLVEDSSGINFAVPVQAVAQLLAQAGRSATNNGKAAQALRAAQTGSNQEAQAAQYQKIAQSTPWAAEAPYNLGIIRLEQGKLEEARELFEYASMLKSPYPEALNNLAIVLYRQEHYNEARDTLLRTVSGNPDFALAYLNLGVVYAVGLRDRDSARNSFKRYLELAPDARQAETIRNWLTN